MTQPLITVDAEELIMALEYRDYDMQHYLDKQTGEFLLVTDDFQEDMEKIEEEPDRYILIEPISSHVGFNVMVDFIEAIPESRMKRDLTDALNRRHPFREFKNALLAYPSAREDWFRFHDSKFTDIARAWLEENKIDATLHVREIR